MSVNPLTAGSGTDPISQLVSKVLERYDTDKNGHSPPTSSARSSAGS